MVTVVKYSMWLFEALLSIISLFPTYSYKREDYDSLYY
jgi:hypothetical protein